MTDKELLELAAKAAGLQEYGFMGGSFVHIVDNTFEEWNPLTDDGDALRLAVKLEINIAMYAQRVKTYVDNLPRAHQGEFGADPYAATRRAIVRAAAAIGRMK